MGVCVSLYRISPCLLPLLPSLPTFHGCVCVSVYDKSMFATFATFATHFSWVCVCVCVPGKHKNTDMDVLGCILVFLSKCPIVMQMRKFKFSQSETLLLGALLDP